jgi:RNA polymerase sigma-B factor
VTISEGRTSGEERLVRRYRQGDLAARDELVERMLPLARRLASRYRHTAEAQEDLEQVASLGLLKAIDRYDPELGPLVRYAVPSILGELKRHFRDRGWGMRVSRSLQERYLKVSEAIDNLTGELGRSPVPRDIAKATGLSLEDVLEALEASTAYAPAALDAPRGGLDEDPGTIGETIGVEEPGFERVELGQSISPALRELPERERRILHLRFVEDLTQSEIAEEIGVSQMHVSRLLRRSIDRLRETAEDQPERASTEP